MDGDWGLLWKNGERKWGLEQIGTLQQDQQSQLTSPVRLLETEPPTKEYTRAGLKSSCINVADVQLGLHVSQITEGTIPQTVASM